VLDLSDSGAAIETKEFPLALGQTAALKLRAKAALKAGVHVGTYTLTGTVARNGVPNHYGLRFSPTVPEQIRNIEVRPRKMMAGAGIVVLAVAVCIFKVRNLVSFWYAPALEAYSLLAAAFVLSRAALSMMYREPKDNGYLPTVSIIIAAKNEEAHISDTLHHCFRSRYPLERLEIIAIDDGSTDRTWEAMTALKAQYPTLKNFQFEKNRGKRHAMACGAKEASGEILIYVDSDSYVEPEAVYRIVQPFIDSKIGAVSGHILAVEEDDNFISKMEAARYYISHRIMKAAESVFGAVTCCPGAFSAYRRSAVLRVLPVWLKQQFLGTRATFGDDRSLTNYILRTHKVIYHAGARCTTYVPDRWRTFFRQQLRWKKSWSRETTVAMRLMYRKHPIAVVSYYASILLTLLSPLMILRALVYLPLAESVNCLPYLIGLFLVYSFLCLFYCYHTQSKNWYYGLAFACLYVSFLCFQNYYAILTVRQNHWGTR
jgi:hyaluronan synthase